MANKAEKITAGYQSMHTTGIHEGALGIVRSIMQNGTPQKPLTGNPTKRPARELVNAKGTRTHARLSRDRSHPSTAHTHETPPSRCVTAPSPIVLYTPTIACPRHPFPLAQELPRRSDGPSQSQHVHHHRPEGSHPRRHGGEDRDPLRTHREPVRRVLHVAPRKNGAVGREERRADTKL